MDALAFDIRIRVGATGDPGDGVNRFIRLKPRVQFPCLRRHHLILERTVTQRHVVVGVQILRVNRQRLLKFCKRRFILSLQVEQPSNLIQNPPVSRKLEGGYPQVFERVVIFAVRLLNQRVEVVHLRSVWVAGGAVLSEAPSLCQASPPPLSYRPPEPGTVRR